MIRLLATAAALVFIPTAAAAAPPSGSLNPPPVGPAPATTRTYVTCHELSDQEFSFVDSLTGRLDANTVMVGYHTYLSGTVRFYVDGVYRSSEYINVAGGGTFSVTYPNTHLAHQYDAYQTADPAYSYPGSRVWSSTGIAGVVPVGANHCQTPKRTV